MVKGRGKGARRKNRILGFSGRPTDQEVDEVCELAARIVMRMMTSSRFLEMVGTATELQNRFKHFGDA